MFKHKLAFESAYLKLTLFYTLIVMAISISFSVALYQISSNEIDQGLGRQTRIFRNMSLPQTFDNRTPDLEEIRLEQLNESNDHLKLNLLYFNLLILILSATLSYVWAAKTLEPIEKAMDAQNRFTADASHELRTPLTAMKSEIEVNLRDKNFSLASSKKLLESNLEEIGKLESLSNALLKLARNENVDPKNFSSVSLEEAVTEAYERVAALADIKEINFKTDLANILINGDQQNLVELFVILLDNAIKYSPAKSSIFLGISKEKSHGIVEITDHGYGIKESDLPYIFERFYRSDTSRNKEKTDGYGLGLSIAKKIVESHRGKIEVKSTAGKGTSFKVYLPLMNK